MGEGYSAFTCQQMGAIAAGHTQTCSSQGALLPNLMVTFGVGMGLSHVAVWQKDQDLTRPDTDLTLGPSAAMCPVGY